MTTLQALQVSASAAHTAGFLLLQLQKPIRSCVDAKLRRRCVQCEALAGEEEKFDPMPCAADARNLFRHLLQTPGEPQTP